MTLLNLIENMSLVELLICGFIGGNMFLSGSFLIQCGVKRYSTAQMDR